MPNVLPTKYRVRIALYRANIFLKDLFSVGKKSKRPSRFFSIFATFIIAGIIFSISIYGLNLRSSAESKNKISATGVPNQVGIYTTGAGYGFNESGFKSLPPTDSGEEIKFVYTKLRYTSGGTVTYIVVTDKNIYFKHSDSASSSWDGKTSFSSLSVSKMIGAGVAWWNSYYLGDNRGIYYTTTNGQAALGWGKSIPPSLIPDFSQVQDFYCIGNNNGQLPICVTMYKKTSGDLGFVWMDMSSTTAVFANPSYLPDFSSSLLGSKEIQSFAGAAMLGGSTITAEIHLSDGSIYRSVNGGAWTSYTDGISYKYGTLIERSMNVSVENVESHYYLTQNSGYTLGIYAENTNVGFFPTCKIYFGAGGQIDNNNLIATYVFAYDDTCDPNNPVPPPTPPPGSDGTTTVENTYNYNYKGISIHTKAENISGGADYANSATAKKGAGHIIKFTLTVSNSDVAKPVDVKFTLPAGFSYVVGSASSTPTDGTNIASPTNGVLKWSGYNAPAGNSTITFNTLAP